MPPAPPGKNVYPWDLTKAEIDAYLAAHPEEQRRAHPPAFGRPPRGHGERCARDLASSRQHPVLDALHPGLAPELKGWRDGPTASMLYAAALFGRLCRRDDPRPRPAQRGGRPASSRSDEEFAGYLRNRARDLLSDDYESGDAAWVTGRFKNLNAQIGAYETYDDELLGTRAFYALSLLAAQARNRRARAAACRACRRSRTALPYDRHKRIREDIPVGVYDVIADFGQSRGGNTATHPAQRGAISRAVTAGPSCCAPTSCARPKSSARPARPGGRWWRRAIRRPPDRRRPVPPHAVARGRPLSRRRPHPRRPRARRRARRRRQSARGDEGRPRLALRRARSSGAAAISPTSSCARIMPAASTARCRTSARGASSPTRPCS